MIQLKARDTFAVGQDRGLGELAKLAAVHEGFQDILLDIEVAVDDGGELGTQLGQIFDRFPDAVVGHVVGNRLGAQVEMIADLLLDEPAAVMTADDGVGKVEILDDGLPFAAVVLGHLATEDRGDRVGPSDGAIGVEQTLAEAVQSCTPAEDEVVAVLDLGKEQAMLATGLLAFALGEERGEGG
jgi:hypothetical protein